VSGSRREDAFEAALEGAPDSGALSALMAETEAPVQAGDRLRERILSRAAGSFEGLVARLTRFFDLDPERVRELLTQIRGSEAWVHAPLEGLELLHLQGGPETAGGDCGFVRLRAGQTFPHHAHEGEEWALVLGGRSEDSTGADAFPGDIVHFPRGTAHSFRAAGSEPLLFAVVHHGIRFEAPAPPTPEGE
jgi:quercetin dioxygenase-like cupin family protein